MARWGLLLNRHGTSLEEKIKLQYSCLFYDYFYVICTGRRTFNSFRSGLKIQQFNKQDTTIFPHLLAKLLGHSVVCEKLAEEGDVAPSKISLRLPIGKTFSREATATCGA